MSSSYTSNGSGSEAGSTSSSSTAASISDSGSGEEGDEYEEVEKILEERAINGKEEYLVKWKHFPKKESSWVPKKDLNCDKKLAAFKRSLVNSRKKSTGTTEPEPGPSSASPGDLVGSGSSSASGTESEEECEVERILKKRTVHGKVQYFIKWKGYEDEDNAWKSKKDLPYCADMIAEFEKSLLKTETERGEDEAGGEGGGGGMSPSCLFSGEVHPLLNPAILANLFQLCPLKILSTSRLVCKTWNENSLVAWRSSSILTFQSLNDTGSGDSSSNDVNDEEDDNANQSPSSSSVKSNKLTELLAFLERECRAIPYRQFHLVNWEFEESNDEDGAQEGSPKLTNARLWNLIKRDVTRLQLSYCTFKDAAAFRKTIFQSCPSMRTLILHGCGSVTNQQPESGEYNEPLLGVEHHPLKSLSISKDFRTMNSKLPISWLELLSHFPGLTELKLKNYHFRGMTELMLCLDGIRIIRGQDDRNLPIRQFELHPPLMIYGSVIVRGAATPEVFSSIQELNLPLESLEVKLSCDVTALQNILSFHGSSLKTIVALRFQDRKSRETVSPGFPCNFPFGLELNNLTELRMRSKFCENMEFIKGTPNLMKLYITEDWNGRDTWRTNIVWNTADEDMIGVKLPSLKELWVGYTLADEDVPRLCNWLPNVEILTMSFNNEQFAVVCKNWRKLRHVHHLGSPYRFTEKGIIGMAVKEVEEETFPNITLLQNLECFLFDKPYCKLTEASVYNGFLKLPKLRILEVAEFGKLVDSKALNALRKNIRRCQLRAPPEMRLRRSRNVMRCKYFN